MMSSSRNTYSSASEWLSFLKQDEAWLSQLQRLQTSADSNTSTCRDDMMRLIGNGDTLAFWEIYQHKVEPVVAEVWEIAELSLPKLKIQTIGMLSMEWLEQHSAKDRKADVCSNSASDSHNALPTRLTSKEAMKYWKQLQKAGFVDADCQLLPETTRKQAMYIAEVFAERTGIKSKWKTFERFWGINNLAQEKWEILETGKKPKRSKEIDMIFED